MLLVLVAGSTVAVTFATASPRETSVASAWTLRIAIVRDVDSLDPQVAFSPGAEVLQATCATLYTYPSMAGLTPRSALPVPELAASLPRTSHDGRTYVIPIRPGWRFSDGTRIRAEDVVASIDRAFRLVLRTNRFTRRLMGDVVGAQAVLDGRAEHVAGVSADGGRVTIRLARPAGDLPARLSMTWFCPVPRRLPASPLETTPGSGPYYIAELLPGRRFVLRRNPHYLGARPARPREIVFTIGGTQASNLAAAQDGQTDLPLDGPPPEAMLGVLRRYGIGIGQFHLRPTLATVYLALNASRPLFRDNPRLRRAVALAVDRPELLRLGGPLIGRRTDQLLPPTMPGFLPADVFPLGTPSLARARSLATGNLRAATAVLYISSEPVGLKRAEVLRHNLAQIGLQLEVRAFPRPVLASRIGTRGEPFDLAITGWTAVHPDPASFLSFLLDGRSIGAENNFNTSYFDDPHVSARISAANRQRGAARLLALGALDVELLRKLAPVVPLYNPSRATFLAARMGCHRFFPTGSVDFGSLCTQSP